MMIDFDSQTTIAKPNKLKTVKKGIIQNSIPLAFKSHYNPFEATFYIQSNKPIDFDLQIICKSGRMYSAIFQAHKEVEIDLTNYANGIYYAVIMEHGEILDTKTIFWNE